MIVEGFVENGNTMFDAIINNPFRVLGVLSNATTKEILAKSSKAKAFCNVGKQVELPWDLNVFLPELKRSVEMIDAASNALTLPEDKLKHALFWFINTSSSDAKALEYIKDGDLEQALVILWREQHCFVAINRAVAYLVKGDWNESLKSYMSVLHSQEFVGPFVHSVCGSFVDVSGDKLSRLLIDELSKEIPLYELFWALSKINDAKKEKSRVGNMISIYAEKELEGLQQKAKAVQSDALPLNCLNAFSEIIERAYPYLAAISEVEGGESVKHKHLSTKVESVVLNGIVDIINAGVADYNSGKNSMPVYTLRTLVGKAKGLTQYLKKMDIDSVARQRLEKQCDILGVLSSKVGTYYDSNLVQLELTTEWDCFYGCKSIQDFRRYSNRFPDGLYKKKAQEAIKTIEKKREQISSLCIKMDETVFELKEEYDELGLLDEFEDKIFSICETVSDCEAYMKLFGTKAKHKKEVERRILDTESYNKCKTFQDYQNYLKDFPNGNYVDSVQAAIEALKREVREDIARCNQMDENIGNIKKKCMELGLLEELDDKCFSICETIADYRAYSNLFGILAKHREEVERKLRDWDSYHNCKSFRDFQNYVHDFPNGHFIIRARASMDEMIRQMRDAIANCNQWNDGISSLKKSCEEVGLLEELDDKCFSLCSLISDYKSYYMVFGPKAKHKKEVERKIEDWNCYQECKTYQDFKHYMNRFPDGICISRARTVVEEVISRNRNTIEQCDRVDGSLASLKKNSEEVGLLEEFDDKCFSLCETKKDFRTYLSLLGDKAKHRSEAESHLALETWWKKIWNKT